MTSAVSDAWRAGHRLVDDVFVGVDHVEVGVAGDLVGDVWSASGVRVSSWSSRAMYWPVASSSAALVAVEIPPACSWRLRWMRGSAAAWRWRAAMISGLVEPSSTRHSSQLVNVCARTGGDRLLEHLQRRVVDGREHRDQRRVVGRVAVPGLNGRAERRRAGQRRRVRVGDRRLHPDRPLDGTRSRRAGGSIPRCSEVLEAGARQSDEQARAVGRGLTREAIPTTAGCRCPSAR